MYVGGSFTGTYTLGGKTLRTSSNMHKAWVAKVDEEGNIVWTKILC
ncbi:MAG: hypothetical protein SNJ77_12740 [Cytophagales bacterium]